MEHTTRILCGGGFVCMPTQLSSVSLEDVIWDSATGVWILQFVISAQHLACLETLHNASTCSFYSTCAALNCCSMHEQNTQQACPSIMFAWQATLVAALHMAYW